MRIKRKFNFNASSRLVTCYHPTPDDVGIRAGNIIKLSVEDNKKAMDDTPARPEIASGV